MASPWVLIVVQGGAMAATRKHHDVGRGGEIPKGSVCKVELWLEKGEICMLTRERERERERGAGRGTEKEREEKMKKKMKRKGKSESRTLDITLVRQHINQTSYDACINSVCHF